eukprot:TRINITY_DN1733_c2_g1_i1.p1 TRINITY_DN1733_c2_g1~~TRINITY_DN1733_c2_g1_i1.p1  ORF type:complete len:1507 (+),score=501.08 TRINITY_DN1733_c2_g1_i1:59-4579(+)
MEAKWVCLLSLLLPSVAGLTKLQAQEIREAALRDFIPAEGATNHRGSDRTDVLGNLVRHSFHDSGTWDASARCFDRGGADGCLLLSDPSNRGLEGVVADLDVFCRRFAAPHPANISLADCWHLVATVAIEASLPAGASLGYTFTWGRSDAATCAADLGRLPAAEGGYAHVMAMMSERLGLTEEDVVALIGAHTLGRMRGNVSGYPGRADQEWATWSSTPAVFDNSYYVELLGGDWRPQQSDDLARHYFYEAGTRRAALIADVSLIYDVGAGSTETNASVDPKQCAATAAQLPDSVRRCPIQTRAGRKHVEHFAANATAFYEAFGRAWGKVLSLGYDSLRPLCDDNGPCEGPSHEPCVDVAPPADACTPSDLDSGNGEMYQCRVDVTGLPSFSMHWSVDDESGLVHFGFTAAAEGWVGASFPQRQGFMAPANAVIGWAGSAGGHSGPFALEETSATSRSATRSDRAGSLIGLRNSSVEERARVTTLRFSCALCTAEVTEFCVPADREIDLNVAYHPTADAAEAHPLGVQSARALRVGLRSGTAVEYASDTSLRDARRNHGAVMMLAWLLFAPGAVWIRRYGKPVFKLGLHASLRSTALFLHIVPALVVVGLSFSGFFVALANFWTFGTIGASAHTAHSIIGHVLMFLIAAQPLGALLVCLLPYEYDHPVSRVTRIGHAVSGYIILSLGIVQVFLGIRNIDALDSVHGQFFVPAMALLTFWGGLFAFAELIKSKYYVRAKSNGSQASSGVSTTLDHVARHNTINDCWVIVHSKAYEVSEWLPTHPGGPNLVMPFAGKDATAAFEEAGHSETAVRRLHLYYRADVEVARVVNSVSLAERVTNALVTLSLDEANELVKDSHRTQDLPSGLCLAFQRLVSNLRMYRDFLPASLVSQESMTLSRQVAAVAPPTGTLGIAFTDICGSTQLWERSPAGMEVAMDLHNDLIRQVLVKHDGYEVKTIGDAFMVAFPSALSACLFGVEVQEGLNAILWPFDEDLLTVPTWRRFEHQGKALFQNGLRLRIGINFGKAEHEHNEITGRVDYRGPLINAAARIEGSAVPGMVLVSESVMRTAGDDLKRKGIASNGVGERSLRGVKDPLELFYLVSPGLQSRDQWMGQEIRRKMLGQESSMASLKGKMPRREDSGPSDLLSAPDTPFSVQPQRNPLFGRKLTSSSPGKSSRTAPTDLTETSEFVPVDNRLQARFQNNMQKTQATVAHVAMVRADDLSHMQVMEALTRCNLALMSVSEVTGRTGGKIDQVAGNEVVVTWNVVSSCAAHPVQAVVFGQLLLDPERPTVALGAATAPLLHGIVGVHRTRYPCLMGPGQCASRALAAMCCSVGARALYIFMPKTPQQLQTQLRPIDVWYFGGSMLFVEEILLGLGPIDDDWDTEASDSTHCYTPLLASRKSSNTSYRRDFVNAIGGDEAALKRLQHQASSSPDDRILSDVVDRVAERVSEYPCEREQELGVIGSHTFRGFRSSNTLMLRTASFGMTTNPSSNPALSPCLSVRSVQ